LAHALGHLPELVHRKSFWIIKADCSHVHLDENRHGSATSNPCHTRLPSDRQGDGVVRGLASASVLLMHVHCQASDHVCLSRPNRSSFLHNRVIAFMG